MKVNFFLKNQQSLVFTNEGFSFFLEFISFLFRSLQLIKEFLLTKLKSHILALDWPDMDFVPVRIVPILCGLPNALCIHCILVLGYICKYLSEKMGFSWRKMFFHAVKYKNKNIPLFRFALCYEISRLEGHWLHEVSNWYSCETLLHHVTSWHLFTAMSG